MLRTHHRNWYYKSTNHLGSPATKQLGGYSTTYSILRVTSVSGGSSRCHSMLLVWGWRVTEPCGTSGLFRLGSTRVTWGGGGGGGGGGPDQIITFCYNDAKCNGLGWFCVPLVTETQGRSHSWPLSLLP